MGLPYEMTPFLVTAVGGEATTTAVQFASRAYINKIVIAQTSGFLGPFTAELFNHADALEGTEASDSSSTTDEGGDRVPLECYRVGPPMIGEGGVLRYFSDEATGGAGFMFVCQDKNEKRQGQKMRNLYVRITPTGAGINKFVVAIGGDSDVG